MHVSDPQPSATTFANPSSSPTSAPIQILVVEDSTSLRRLYCHVLMRAGYSVLAADSGAAARELIAAQRPDIILLDRVLPDGDGAEIGEWIKGSPELASTYVLMLSGIKTSEDDRLSGLETAADDYMLKPVDKRELLARVKVGVRLKSAQRAVDRLAAVVQQAVEAVLITDDGGKVQYVNPEFERMTGFTPAELIDRRLSDAGDEGVALGDLGRQFLGVIARQQPWSGYTTLIRKGGEPLEIEATIFPIHDPHRGITSFVALLRDLSERRRAEKEREVILTVASALRRASTRDEMAPVILDEIMALFNVAGAALTSLDHMTGEAFVELARGLLAPLAGLRTPTVHSLTVEILASGQAFFSNGIEALAGPRWSNELHPVHALLGVPMVAHNRGIGVIWIASTGAITTQAITLLLAIADMSASALHRVALYRELEEYAADLERRVAERTRELEAANEQLKELDRLKSKFVSNVTHELRTPVSNLKLYLSLLQRGNLERRAHYEAMLRDSVERLGELIDDILNLSRLEIARFQPTEFAPTDLNAIVRQVAAHYQPQAEAAGLQLLIDADPDLPLIAGNFNHLAQLVTNLTVNGLHFTRQGYVRISTLQPENPSYVKLIVEDTGVGILPDDLPHIFDRFYRGNHRQAEDIPGTGLGLAIVQEIVAIHRGELSLRSEVDVGTRVEVLLPVEHPDSV